MNRVEQHIFASDFDQFEALLTATSSQISRGKNILSNLTTIQVLSTH